jgi:hypothetical protein
MLDTGGDLYGTKEIKIIVTRAGAGTEHILGRMEHPQRPDTLTEGVRGAWRVSLRPVIQPLVRSDR